MITPQRQFLLPKQQLHYDERLTVLWWCVTDYITGRLGKWNLLVWHYMVF